MEKDLEPKKLLLQSTKPLAVGAMEKNVVKQMFVSGEGEVVARFNNFKREPKFFTYLIEETDAEGNPLHRTVEEEAKPASRSTIKKIDAAFFEASSALFAIQGEGADITGLAELIKTKLEEIKDLVSK